MVSGAAVLSLHIIDFRDDWQEVPDPDEPYDNGFKAQWESLIRHFFEEDAPFPWTLLEGAKGVQLAEAALKSWAERRWIEIEPLVL